MLRLPTLVHPKLFSRGPAVALPCGRRPAQSSVVGDATVRPMRSPREIEWAGLVLAVEECAELRGGLEERNRIQRLQSGREGIRERPHRARREFRMRRLEVVAMNVGGKRTRNAQFAFDERPINHEFRLLIRDLPGAPGLDLLPERLEIALNPVHADRQLNRRSRSSSNAWREPA